MSNYSDNVLTFSSPTDSKLGFLSQKSMYPFVIAGKRWLSVYHYVQAKRFNGLEVEEQIRFAHTAFQVDSIVRKNCRRRMAISEYGVPIKAQVDEQNNRERYLYDATLAKFSQHPTLLNGLIFTDPATLVDTTDQMYGPVVMNVRTKLIKSQRKKLKREAKSRKTKVISQDLTFGKLEGKMRDRVIEVVNVLVEQKKFKSGLSFEEVIYNSVCALSELTDEEQSRVKSYIIKMADKIGWGYIYKKWNNFLSVASEVKTILENNGLPHGQKALNIITFILMWFEKKYIPSSEN